MGTKNSKGSLERTEPVQKQENKERKNQRAKYLLYHCPHALSRVVSVHKPAVTIPRPNYSENINAFSECVSLGLPDLQEQVCFSLLALGRLYGKPSVVFIRNIYFVL